jgi:hypothetical protein
VWCSDVLKRRVHRIWGAALMRMKILSQMFLRFFAFDFVDLSMR